MKFNLDGSLDVSFDSDGWKSFSFPGAERSSKRFHRSQQQFDCCSWYDFGPEWQTFTICNIALVGFLSTGMIDTSFGMEGWVSTDSFRGLSTASRGALQADGKLLVVGSTSSIPDGFSGGYEHALALARYNVDGSRDTSFGNDGRVVTKYSNGLATEGTDVAVKPDGSILVLGRKSGSFAVSKYLSDGNLDGSFGNQEFEPPALVPLSICRKRLRSLLRAR